MENSGLHSNNITSIALDKQGNKWFGTYDWQVTKFDGNSWFVYDRSNAPLPKNSMISSITIDDQGAKWVGAYNTSDARSGGGVLKFDDTNWTVYPDPYGPVIKSPIYDIAIDRQGIKWVGTYANGLWTFDDINWTGYLTGLSICTIAIDAKDHKYFAGFDSNNDAILYTYDNTSWSKINLALEYDQYITSMAIDGEGKKWIGIGSGWWWSDSSGLAVMDGNRLSYYNGWNSSLPFGVNALALDQQGNIWIGSEDLALGVLAKHDGTSWETFDDMFPNNLLGCVNALAIDDRGNKWIATDNNGVIVFNENGVNIGPATNSSDELAVNSNKLLIYPNPATDFITVDNAQSGKLELFNASGAVLKRIDLQETSNRIDISALPVGIYTLRLATDDAVATAKFVKK